MLLTQSFLFSCGYDSFPTHRNELLGLLSKSIACLFHFLPNSVSNLSRRMLTDSFWMENWLVQCSLCCLSHSHKKGCNEVVPPHLADYRGSRSIINPFVEPPMKVTTTQIVNQIQHMKLYYNTLLKSVWASYLPSRHVIVFQPSSSTNPSGLPALGLGWLSATLVWGNSALTSRLYSLNINIPILPMAYLTFASKSCWPLLWYPCTFSLWENI